MHVLRYGAESRRPSRSIKIGNACIKIWNRVFSALCDNFRHWDFFEKNQNFSAGPPARIIITPVDIQYACGYFITRADTALTYCYVRKLWWTLKELIRMYKNGQKTWYKLHIYIKRIHVITYKREYINIVNPWIPVDTWRDEKLHIM